MNEYAPRIVQLVLAVPLLVLTITHFYWNKIGQNIINFTAVAIFVVGLDNIIMLYRFYLNKQSIQYQATFILFCLLTLGVLFQKFNRSPDAFGQFNTTCYVIDMIVLITNLVFLLGVVITLIAYMVRQIYRLMTQTLLTDSNNMQRGQIQAILNMKKPYRVLINANPSINNQCSICYLDFLGEDQVVMLPGCDHCFHPQCIEEWLNQKANCPNCRNNLRLSIM